MIDAGRIKPELVDYFSEADAERQQVLDLESKTDRDFMDSSGNVDKGLKTSSKNEVRIGKNRFNEKVSQGLESVASSETLADDADRVVIYESLDDRLSGWKKVPEYAFTPDTAETAADYAIGEAEKFRMVTEWWRNPSEFFAHFEGGQASLYYTKLAGRVGLTGSFSTYSRPSISANFQSGVKLLPGKGMIPQVAEGATELKVGLFGWDGNTHKRTEDFKGDAQDRYKFLDDESVHELNSQQRFYMRIAREVLAETLEIDTIEIPAPSEQFSVDLSQTLAKSAIRELIGLDVKTVRTRPIGGSRSPIWKTVAVKTPLTGMSRQELHRTMRAANITKELQAQRIELTVAKLQQSDNISDYANGIRVEQLANRFIEDIL